MSRFWRRGLAERAEADFIEFGALTVVDLHRTFLADLAGVNLVEAVVEGLVSFLGWVWGRLRTAPSSSGGEQHWSGCCGGDCSSVCEPLHQFWARDWLH